MSISLGRESSQSPRLALAPTVVVIFGGAGDLTWRKLIPSLFDLERDGRMPARFAILAVDRAALSTPELRRRLHEGVRQFSRQRSGERAAWAAFASHLDYQRGDFAAATTYEELVRRLALLRERLGGSPTHVFHLAVPPALVEPIVENLAEARLHADRARSRIVIEKPIGHDRASARQLDRTLTRNFRESQIFRIDHYLGKETVQNILAFRFANPFFEPIWDRRYVERVTLTVAETVGVGHRGGYYEGAGALRDMVQNHLMQLLCLVAMEPMVSFEANDIRNKKLDVLHAVRPLTAATVRRHAVRGQYGRGTVEGQRVRAYRDEDGVAADSTTETFVALRLFVDDWRWEGVPFHLVTGKRLPERASKISIQFRRVPHQPFPPEAARQWRPSQLVMSIQPEEAIVLGFQAKYPGPLMELRPAEMHFQYRENFAVPSPDAYETLLWDVMRDDPTLFMRADQVEAAWDLITPVLDLWGNERPRDFPNYAAGTWGPASATPFYADVGPRGRQPDDRPRG